MKKVIKSIEEVIVDGMADGYNRNLILKVDYNNFQSEIAEKLFHIKVADALIEWNENYEFSIHIEYCANNFCNNAFSRSSDIIDKDFQALFAETTYRSIHKPHVRPRKKEKKKNIHGRLDIVLTKEIQDSFFHYERSIYGIEIKAINPSTKELTFDIIRLQKAIEDTDDVSDNSIIAGYSAFLIRLDKPNKIMNQEAHIFLKKEYEAKLNTILNQCDWSKTKYDIIYSPIVITTAEEYITQVFYNDEYPLDAYDVEQNTGAVYCVLIKISRNSETVKNLN